MRNLFNLKGFIALFLFASAVVVGYGVSAQGGHADVEFPIPELGNCTSEQECIAYCNEPDNFEGCLAFALENDIISAQEAEIARNVGRFDDVGPGGCDGRQECEIYCEEIANIDECLDFAEDHDLLSDRELDEARRVANALQAGVQLPGGCTSKDECELYCESLDHIRECVAFGEQAGLIPPDELEEAHMVLAALDAGVQLPGGCQGKDECDAYCENPQHIEECLDFAAAAGFIPPEELEDARKIAPFMARGEMPGNCRSREECEAYCSAEDNVSECAEFFSAAGLISPEEAELLIKTGGRGPGDCKGQAECDAYCNNSAHQEECFAFAKEHNLIPEEELRNLEEGIHQFNEGLDQAPPEVRDCLNNIIGADVISNIEAGNLLPNPEIGDQMRQCFEQFGPKGPGGCTSEEECIAFCSDPANFEECGGFGPDSDDGEFHDGSSGDFQDQFDEQFQQQFDEEFEEQFDEEFRKEFPDDFGESFNPDQFNPDQFNQQPSGTFNEDIQHQIEEEIQQQIEQQIQEEIQKQIDAEIQHQIEQQIQEEIQQQTSPDGTIDGTGSILDAFQNFLRFVLPLLAG